MHEARAGLGRAALGVIATAWALAGPVIALAPLGMAPLLAMAAILGVFAHRLEGRGWPKPALGWSALVGLLLAWMALSLLWHPKPAFGARTLPDFSLMMASALALAALSRTATPVQRRTLARALVLGAVAGLALLAIEVLFDFPLYRLVMGDNSPKLVDLLESKRSADALPLLAWPAALALERLGRRWLGLALATGVALASFKLTAAAATLGMSASLPVFVLAIWRPQWARRAIQLSVAAAFALILPLAILAYDHGATHWAILKQSARHRVEIWHFAAMRTFERPILGHGFNASRFIPNGDAVSQFLPPGFPIIPLHPHDAFLQIWLELGVVGVGIGLVFVWRLVNATRVWPAAAAPFGLAAMTAALLVAAIAFGIWQSWWVATLAFAVVASRSLLPDDNET